MLKCHENAFFIVGIVKERIRNWILNFLLVKEDPDQNPDPKKIVSDPQHCILNHGCSDYSRKSAHPKR
jgi:hypothetical protein